MDALNLANYDALLFEAPPTIDVPKRSWQDKQFERGTGRARRKLFGR